MSNSNEGLKTFIFDNGVEVKLKPVPPLIIMAVKKQYAQFEPVPPLKTIAMPNGKTKEIADHYDPYYKQLKAEHAQLIENVATKVLLNSCVVVTMDAEKLAEVAAKREEMAVSGLELEPDDKYVYVAHCLVSDATTLTRLSEAIQRLSEPTEAGIQEATATFPGNI